MNNIPFPTTSNQVIFLKVIIEKMIDKGIDINFVNQAYNIATLDQGMYDLMNLWFYENDEKELDEIIKEIKSGIIDYI